MSDTKIFDFIGIGLGPFNLGLACLSHNLPNLDALFIEQRSEFNWHPGMMIPGVTLQTPFMSDLVTLADPSHPLSFLNYLKKQGKLYRFYIRESFFIERGEYNQYCRWAIEQLDTVLFNKEVVSLEYSYDKDCYLVRTKSTQSDECKTFYAKKIVLGTGPSPSVPACIDIDCNEDVFHSSKYLKLKEQAQSKKSITIVGSGQSAAEIFYDLLQEIEKHNYQLNWVTRSPRFFPLDYSKLTLEMTSPEYVDYFFSLPSEKRDQLINNQKNLYKGINFDLINSIFDLLYTKSVYSKFDVNLMTNCEVTNCKYDQGINLTFKHTEQDKEFSWSTGSLILATGYAYKAPAFLEPVWDRIRWDDKGRFDTNRNYSIDREGCELFVQNAELHTHGFVTPDLGMACYRNSVILKEITGVEHFPIEQSIAFQTFGVPTQDEMANIHPSSAHGSNNNSEIWVSQ